MFVQPLTYAYNMQERRTTKTISFSHMLSREPQESLPLSRTRPRWKGDSNLPSQDVKINSLHLLHHLIEKARKKSNKSGRKYKRGIDRRVRHTREFTLDDLVYVDSLPASKSCQGLTFTVVDPSVNLSPMKYSLYRVVRATPDTVTTDIDELRNFVASD